jgi:hypothetical protein
MVPFFKSLQGNIWRSYSTKSWNMVAGSTKLPSHSSNRLQKREARLRYHFPQSAIKGADRVSKVPPYIPSPEPLSPFMPPPNITYLHPSKVAGSISDAPRRHSYEASIRGTSVSGTLYDSESEDFFNMSVSRVKSSSSSSLDLDLSNSLLLGDSPLLGNYPSPPSSNQPTKPLPAYSPLLSGTSSFYSSCSSAPPSPIPTPHSPLLSKQDSQEVSIFGVSHAQTNAAPPPRFIAQSGNDDTTRAMNRQTMPNAITPHKLDGVVCPTRSASTTHHPKFSTTPRLHSPPATIIPPLPKLQ